MIVELLAVAAGAAAITALIADEVCRRRLRRALSCIETLPDPLSAIATEASTWSIDSYWAGKVSVRLSVVIDGAACSVTSEGESLLMVVREALITLRAHKARA